jgi:hypoxanthine phosphoribosyltransferase
MANVISEYFKLARKDEHPVFFAAVVARSYTDIRAHDKVMIDGWTYAPEHLRHGDKILLVDDIYDTGRTINYLVEVLQEKGIPRKDIKVAVHDYKYYTYKTTQLPIQPDYWCRKFDIADPNDDRWIHYMSHELIGLNKNELEAHYFTGDAELQEALMSVLG